MDADAANMNETWVQETSMKLQLLRGWKRFNTDQNDIELLLMSMEEVLGMVGAFLTLTYPFLWLFDRTKRRLWRIFMGPSNRRRLC